MDYKKIEKLAVELNSKKDFSEFNEVENHFNNSDFAPDSNSVENKSFSAKYQNTDIFASYYWKYDKISFEELHKIDNDGNYQCLDS
ncbi:MAG: hypothetical protein GY841_14240 [FCB group bacterium]|nr:hypothetical protein [FCB group bacterium]